MYSKKYFIGNWKMNGLKKDLQNLKNVEKFIKNVKFNNCKLIFCPPYTLINYFRENIKSKKISIGSQDISVHANDSGPFTGSVSSKMVKNLKCDYTLIGHSERRVDGDNDVIVSKKIDLATQNNLNVILCVGESFDSYKKNKSFQIVKSQIIKALVGNKSKLNKIIIAYEPIWSIGTGLVPECLYLDSFFKKIKLFIQKEYKKNLPLLYGGSVSSKNIRNFKNIHSCSGFLIGGASLKSKDYIDIIKKYYN